MMIVFEMTTLTFLEMLKIDVAEAQLYSTMPLARDKKSFDGFRLGGVRLSLRRFPL
jgi:hypothetical protein